MTRKNKASLIKLSSSAKTGVFFIKKKNLKTLTKKLQFSKYDPKQKKHIIFKEEKIK